MKGECDGRELTPRAPMSGGTGCIPGHSKEGSTGRVEAAVMEDHQGRKLQVPGSKAAAQGNGTRGFTVADLTKRDDWTAAKGNVEVPSVTDGAVGIIRVPSFKGEGQERPLGSEGEVDVQERNEDRATGCIKIPTINKECWDLSHAAAVTRVSHDISGSLQLPGVGGQDPSCGTGTLTKGETQNTTELSTTVTSNVMNTKRENQNSAAEILSVAATKRLNQDADVGLEMPGEVGIKRLKKDGAPGTAAVTDGPKVIENNTTDLLNLAAVKRISQDDAVDSLHVTDVKRIRQDSVPEMTGVTTMTRENPNSVPEAVNGTHLRMVSQSTTTTMECADTSKTEGQDSALPIVNTAHAMKVTQGVGTEDLKAEKQDGGMSEALEGNSVQSPLSALMREKGNGGSEDYTLPSGETRSEVHPKGNLSLPDMKKETLDRDRECPGVPDIKQERQGKGQHEGTDTERLAVLRQHLEKNGEKKQENIMKDDEKNVSEMCQGEGGEGKSQVCASLGTPHKKPEMVSIETQCDDSSMLPDKSLMDDYAFLGEDAGVPGECLGGCEPGKKPHKCCQCDTSFRTPYELSRHGRVHTGERPYQCRLCHRCFKRKDHVEVHTRRHVEDRRFACNECGVCFVTSSCLLRHQRRTHQAPGTILPGEGENGEGEMEAGDTKSDGKDQLVSKDAQKNGRRNKKNKPDSTYRPGGKTVCIIKKRNLRQRSYSFVELEDDVECFESDEEDRIPFLKVQEQRREVEHEETGSQSSQLEHSLFPPSLFNPEASLSHLLLLGEVSRLLSHSVIPGPPEAPATQANIGSQVGRMLGLPQDPDEDSDDSDCDPPLVACDVTFMEGEGEVTGISLPDDAPEDPQPEAGQDKALLKSGPLHTATKTGPTQTTLRGGPCQKGPKQLQGSANPPTPPDKSPSPLPSPPCKAVPAPPTTNSNKVGGTGVGAMGVPRTAWVVPSNNAKGKNTCDACRRRNEANRLAQLEREKQTLSPQTTLKQEAESKPQNPPKRCEASNAGRVRAKSAVVTPPTKPQASKAAANKRGRKAATKKRRPIKSGGGGNGGAAATSQRPHKCHLCPFNFRSATELKRHASTHSGERPFLCELCGAGFMRKCHLQLHVRRHSGERRHACQECRMRFFTPSDLARHQAIHQTGDKPLECHLCHLTFRRAFHLERHIRRHNEAAPFACKLCGAFFSSAAALRSHDKHHRTPGPHACPDCTAAFTTATALSRHRRVHSARHHRLLRAIERHATAKSSYECVSSGGSPLSLVIRKVAPTVGTGPTKNTPDTSHDPGDNNKEEETEGDKISSGLSTTDKETESQVEGMETATPTLPPSKEAEGGDKTTTTDKTKGEVEGREGITDIPSAPDEIKEDRESITFNPSITGKVEDDREKMTSLASADRGKQGTETSALTSSVTERINEEGGKITSSPSGKKEKDGSENTTLIPSMTEKVKGSKTKRRAKTLATIFPVSKEVGSKEDVNGSHCREEKSALIQENQSVFGCSAVLGQYSSGAVNLSMAAGKDVVNHKEAPVLPCINNGKEVGSERLPREAGSVEGSGHKSSCSNTKQDLISSHELNSKPELGFPPMSKERNSCSLLLPTSREMEAVKEEMHCRTTYQLAAPPGGQEGTLQAGPGYPSEQGGSRGSKEEGGQQGSVREGLTTTS